MAHDEREVIAKMLGARTVAREFYIRTPGNTGTGSCYGCIARTDKFLCKGIRAGESPQTACPDIQIWKRLEVP